MPPKGLIPPKTYISLVCFLTVLRLRLVWDANVLTDVWCLFDFIMRSAF